MRRDNYHIYIKNLTTGREEGFMLASGDAPYNIQGVDNVAQRVADGEILYSDFTNSRVFAQSDWSKGISKYWDPERIYSAIYPSKKYKDKKNIVIREGEFTLGGAVSEKMNLTGPMARGETAGVVYMGVGMILYRSTDFGSTWSAWKDFSGVPNLSDVNEITDIKYIDTEPFMMTHSGSNLPIPKMQITNIQCLFVCFYNRATKKSGMARYDIKSFIRAYGGSTFRDGWTNSMNVAYSSYKAEHTINTNGLNPGTVGMHYHKYNDQTGALQLGCLMNSGWAANGLFPGQRFKATRNTTGEQYMCTVTAVGGGFAQENEFSCTGLPGHNGSDDSQNQYTISEIGRNHGYICLPISSSMEEYTGCGAGLGQNIVIAGVTYHIRGIGDGRNSFGFLPTYYPRPYSGSQNYVMLQRVNDTLPAFSAYGNGTVTVQNEPWIYKKGDYYNNVTKLIHVPASREHLWGYNHVDLHNKLYDVAYGEIATNASYSNIYAVSLDGVLHSAQNHTITFNDGDCPMSGHMEGTFYARESLMYVGTQYGTNLNSTQGNLLRFALQENQTKPEYTVMGTVDGGITAMVSFQGRLYLAVRPEGYIYDFQFQSGNVLTQIAKVPCDPATNTTDIDAMTYYSGKVICSYKLGAGVYVLDPNTRSLQAPLIEADVLCSIEGQSNLRVENICNTGGLLLFSAGGKTYNYDKDGVSETGYMESSIYGGYISNVNKLWVYAYVRVEKWMIDAGQRVALQVSLDEGKTWSFCPTSPGKSFSPTNSWNDDHSVGHSNSTDKQQLIFFFPYYTQSGTILYRCWLKKGSTVKPVVNHIGVHFNLNYRQELLFNYQLELNKSQELLGGRTIEKDVQIDKLNFLKDIWNNQYMVELTDVNGMVYTCIPFSDDRTPGQGLIISTSNSNTARMDIDNLTYRVGFSLKTIANYQKVL